jgi:hypothetical protein
MLAYLESNDHFRESATPNANSGVSQMGGPRIAASSPYIKASFIGFSGRQVFF